MAKKVILITDDTILQSSDKTRHLAILRNISYMTQQFSGYLHKGYWNKEPTLTNTNVEQKNGKEIK